MTLSKLIPFPSSPLPLPRSINRVQTESAIFGAVISYKLKPARRHSAEWDVGNRKTDRMSVRSGREDSFAKRGWRDQSERVNKSSSIIKVQGNESPLWMRFHKEKSRIFSVPLTIFLSASFSPRGGRRRRRRHYLRLVDIYLSVHKSRRFRRAWQPNSRKYVAPLSERGKKEDARFPARCIIDPSRRIKNCSRIDRPPVGGETAMKMDTR